MVRCVDLYSGQKAILDIHRHARLDISCTSLKYFVFTKTHPQALTEKPKHLSRPYIGCCQTKPNTSQSATITQIYEAQI